MKLSKYIIKLTIFVHQTLREGGGGSSLSLPTYLQSYLVYIANAEHLQLGFVLTMRLKSQPTHPVPA